MNIKYNYQESDAYLHNIAYIRALLIKSTINNLYTKSDENNKVTNMILEYLKTHE